MDGSFRLPGVHYDPTTNISFTESIAEQGRVAGTTVLSKQQVAASQWISNPFGLCCRSSYLSSSTVCGRSMVGRFWSNKFTSRRERCPGLLDYSLDQSLTDLMSEKFGIIEHRSQISMRSTALSDQSRPKHLGHRCRDPQSLPVAGHSRSVQRSG